MSFFESTVRAHNRRYNKADHPIAFHKGDMFAASKKKIADQGPAPDNDEVFEVSLFLLGKDRADEEGRSGA